MRRIALALLAAALLSGCVLAPGSNAPPDVRLGAPTSVRDSGLLDVLVDAFERDSGLRVHAAVAGSGEVLAKARRGDLDVVLAHSPAQEAAFVADGHAASHAPVMTSRFLLVGPRHDPAGVRGAGAASDALASIAAAEAPFASRGDLSGTHEKERALWDEAGLRPSPAGHPWYFETGAGQSVTLLVAEERAAYALADEPSWLTMRANGRLAGLEVLLADDERLANPYSVLVAKEAPAAAARFADWLAGPSGADVIRGFAIDGTAPFQPTGAAR